MVALIGTAYVCAGGQPGAQQPRMRVAVINLQEVIKNYAKWQAFEKQYKERVGQYDAAFEKMKADGVKINTDLSKLPPDAKEREGLEQKLRELDYQVKSMSDHAKKELGKLRDDNSVLIYRDVEEAVKVYARSNDIEMVMHFNDAITPADLYHPVNIQRKLQTGACMPMFMHPGMNITDAITQMLNQRVGAAPPRNNSIQRVSGTSGQK
jgi:Skp family chaperone for outer membrane proteins